MYAVTSKPCCTINGLLYFSSVFCINQTTIIYYKKKENIVEEGKKIIVIEENILIWTKNQSIHNFGKIHQLQHYISSYLQCIQNDNKNRMISFSNGNHIFTLTDIELDIVTIIQKDKVINIGEELRWLLFRGGPYKPPLQV